ncbi:MAG: ParB/RepB/Spo0J family partition protein [Rhodospirillales bacterium]|nr:ParB/RepB/Spo0J family partition protein [Rhodospirillales bacterium]
MLQPASTAPTAPTALTTATLSTKASAPKSELIHIAHAAIHPSPVNPRKHFDTEKIAQLADSIAAQGLLQNLVVRMRPKGKPGEYEIAAGENRWRAVAMLIADGRWPKDAILPVNVRTLDDREVIELALTENVQRKDLTPMEEAEAFQSLVKLKVPTADIARRVGCSQRHVQLRLDLVERLHPAVQKALREGVIRFDHAREMTRAPHDRQTDILKEIIPGRGGEARLDRASEIRRAVQQSLVPVGRALFDIGLYTGEIRADETDPKQRYFMDVALFERLQKQAIAGKRAELLKKWKWVAVDNVHEARHLPWHYEKKHDHPLAGAVITVGRDGEVAVHAGVIDRTDGKRGGSKSRSSGGTTARAAKNADNFDERAFDRACRDIKLRALQSAIVSDPRAAQRIVCLALLPGGGNIADGLGGVGVVPHKHGDPAPAVKAAFKQHLATLVKLDGGETWAHLVAMAWPQLDHTFAAVVAAALEPRFGRHWKGGDDPCLVAIARTLGADVGKIWTFDQKFLDLCGVRQLAIIARDRGVGATKQDTKSLRTQILAGGKKLAGYVPPWLRFAVAADITAACRTAPAATPAAGGAVAAPAGKIKPAAARPKQRAKSSKGGKK